MSTFNPDKRAEQLVPAITMFDGLDGVIFPLRVGLVAPTQNLNTSGEPDNQNPIRHSSILERCQLSVIIRLGSQCVRQQTTLSVGWTT